MGQPQLLRRGNRRTITQLLLLDGALTRPQLAERSGLSKVTVNAVVQELLDHRVAQLTRSAALAPGRTPQLVTLHEQLGTILALDLQQHVLQAALLPLRGPALMIWNPTYRPDEITAHLLEVIEEVLRRAEGTLKHVLIGLPAPVDAQGCVREPNVTRHLDLQVLRSRLDHAGVSCTFENDANLVALAVTDANPDWTDVAVLIERPSGIGMGLFLGGQLYRGVHGRAGELGRAYWPGAEGVEHLEHLRGPERLTATAFMLAGLIQALDLHHVVLGLSDGRAAELQRSLLPLLDESVTTSLLTDVDAWALRGATRLAQEQAQSSLLERVEELQEGRRVE